MILALAILAPGRGARSEIHAAGERSTSGEALLPYQREQEHLPSATTQLPVIRPEGPAHVFVGYLAIPNVYAGTLPALHTGCSLAKSRGWSEQGRADTYRAPSPMAQQSGGTDLPLSILVVQWCDWFLR